MLECDREVNDYFIKWLVDYDHSHNGQIASNLDRVFQDAVQTSNKETKFTQQQFYGALGNLGVYLE